MIAQATPAETGSRTVDRKALQTRLLLADRMTSIGTLAAGVAHEINNPLAYVMGNLDYAGEEIARMAEDLREIGALLEDAGVLDDKTGGMLDRAGDVLAALREAREGADRVSTIVRDLNVFSRGDEDVRAPVDLRRVINSAVNMTRNEIKHRARLVRDFSDIPLVEANEARLGQVFVNLLLNAAQAIPEGQADRNQIVVATRVSDEGQVVVEVHDTGGGIPKDIMGRLFDPFFTTKPVGVGSGLGLSICHAIVSALDGQILVDSQVGVGSVFSVLLPPASSGAREPAVREIPVEGPRRAQVLVVDDDAVMGQSVRRLLSGEHDVTVVSHARDVLEALASGKTWDVILCDLMMPEMTGMDLHAELVRASPGHAGRMVFLTGGAFTPRARSFLASVDNPRIDKPFDAGALRAVIRKCLD